MYSAYKTTSELKSFSVQYEQTAKNSFERQILP